MSEIDEAILRLRREIKSLEMKMNISLVAIGLSSGILIGLALGILL